MQNKVNKKLLQAITIKNFPAIIIFSGNSAIKICAEIIDVTLDDQGIPWDTKIKPKHTNI